MSPATPTVRTWLPLLSLYLLAPITAELLSGSTPLRLFFQPATFIFLTGLYGSGAVIAREIARRRGLRWSGVLLLGAAYGVLEEGLVITSWFNPVWPGASPSSAHGRLLGIDLPLAFWLTVFHAVISITIPVLLVESIFPRRAQRLWLRRRGLMLMIVWLGLISAAGLAHFGFQAYRRQGYTHPPPTYVVALLIAIILVWSALKQHGTSRLHSRKTPRAVPGLWALRIGAGVATLAFWLTFWGLQAVVRQAPGRVLIMAVIVLMATWRVRSWARRPGWGARQRLALGAGVAGCLSLVWDPVFRFVIYPHRTIYAGIVGVGIAYVVLLIYLAWRTRDDSTASTRH